MTNQDYIKMVARLKEIEELVKNPESSLDKIDELIEETKQIVTSCYGYTRGLKAKVESLNKVNMNDLEEDDYVPQSYASAKSKTHIPSYVPDADLDIDLPF